MFLFRVGTATPDTHYSPGARAVLEALTSVDPSSAPWIAVVDDVWHVRGIPTNLTAIQMVERGRAGLWEQASLEGAWDAYQLSEPLTPEERELVGINHLGRHWRRTHRSEDAPLFAQELRRKAYQKRKEQIKEGQVIHIMPDGTVVTHGMLERLIAVERTRRTIAVQPLTNEDKKTHLPGEPVEEELV